MEYKELHTKFVAYLEAFRIHSHKEVMTIKDAQERVSFAYDMLSSQRDLYSKLTSLTEAVNQGVDPNVIQKLSKQLESYLYQEWYLELEAV